MLILHLSQCSRKQVWIADILGSKLENQSEVEAVCHSEASDTHKKNVKKITDPFLWLADSYEQLVIDTKGKKI